GAVSSPAGVGPRGASAGMGSSCHPVPALEPCVGSLLPRLPPGPGRPPSVAPTGTDWRALYRYVSLPDVSAADPGSVDTLEAGPNGRRRPAAGDAGGARLQPLLPDR